MNSVVTALGSTGHPTRPPANQELLGMQTAFCHHNNLLSGFLFEASGETRCDHFSRLSYPAICKYEMVGKFPLTLWQPGAHRASLWHQAEWHGVCFTHGLLSATDPPGAPGRGSHHRNSKTTHESVLERKYSTVWGRFLI